MQRAFKWFVGLAGLGIAGGGVGLAALLWLLPRLLGRPDPALTATLPTPVALFALAALGLCLGIPLAWTAYRSLQGIPSRRLLLPSFGWLLAAFVALLLLGQAIVGLQRGATLWLPPVHFVVSALPALAVVAGMARTVQARGLTVTWRETILNLNHGAILSVLGAVALQLLAVVVIGMVAVLALAVLPDGMASLRRLSELALRGDASVLAEAARSPVLLVAVGSLLVVVAPLSEEALKGAVVGLLGYRRPTQAQAFLWGSMAGAGFAWVEGMFASATVGEVWAITVAARAGTTVVHAAGGGLAALGWRWLVVERRWPRAGACYLAGVALHGAWNVLIGLLGLVGLQVQTRLGDGLAALAGGGAMLLLVALLGILWLTALAILVYGARRLDGTASPAPAVLTASAAV